MGMGEVLINVGQGAMSLASRTFDLVVDTWRKTAYPAIVTVLERAWLWLKAQLGCNIMQQAQVATDVAQQVAE